MSATDDRPEDSSREDVELARLLSAHNVPPPSPGFVDDTVFRLQLHATRVPEASEGFVDRVVGAIHLDRQRDGTPVHQPAAREPAAPEPIPMRAPLWPKVTAGLIAAAALVLALIPWGEDDAPPRIADVLSVHARPQWSANGLTRQLSFVAHTVATEPASEAPSAPQFYLPPPPSDAALLQAGLVR